MVPSISVLCNHSLEALLPKSEAILEPILGAHARCEVCTIPRDGHTMTPPSTTSTYRYASTTLMQPNCTPLARPFPPLAVLQTPRSCTALVPSISQIVDCKLYIMGQEGRAEPDDTLEGTGAAPG